MPHLDRPSRLTSGGKRRRGAAALAWSAVAATTGATLLAAAAVANAAEPRTSGGHGSGDPAAEVARLDRQLRELRATLGEVQRSEREHFEIVRRLLEKGAAANPGGAAASNAGAPLGPLGAADGSGASDAASASASDGATSGAAQAATPARPVVPLTLATVTGRVTTRGPGRNVYVYLEGFRSNAGRRAELEIVQTHKTFEPAFAVALAGTRATFPNRDTFFHNVFSTTPTPFDLGTYRADEKAPSVTLSSPGVVEIFCNIHAQMQAQILVVPNRVFARVADDGTFRLDKVPAGRRKLVAWGPGLRPVRLDVVVPAGGTQVSFELEPAPPTRHTNKFGLPYGAYKD